MAWTVAASLTLAACQTTSTATPSSGRSAWVIDSVAQKCAASIIGGAIVGGVIGAITGGGDRVARGAAIGGVAGVGICAVIATLDANDRARIREAQLRAAQSDEPQSLSYRGTDGLQREVRVRPDKKVIVEKDEAGSSRIVGPASPTDQPVRLASGSREVCTLVLTSAAIETKGATDIPAQMVCRNADGDLAPMLVASTS